MQVMVTHVRGALCKCNYFVLFSFSGKTDEQSTSRNLTCGQSTSQTASTEENVSGEHFFYINPLLLIN